KMNCSNCGKSIPAERAEIFSTCVKCTKQTRKIGFMEYSHKTAPALIMIDGDDKQSLELARRAFNRER
ncbi:hypothetical protein KDA08_05945, partial [Candidatus Saccharibacteria bacterium]|nr:hypothetical protein [Candidatus Saccharibacteria bacterium]